VFDESRSWLPLADWLITNSYAQEVWILNTKDNVHSSLQKSGTYWHLRDLAEETRFFLRKICDSSGVEKLTYIGHSQGTSQLLALLTMDSGIERMLEKTILLAPVTVPDVTNAPYLVRLLLWRVVPIIQKFWVSEMDSTTPSSEKKLLRDDGIMAGLAVWLHHSLNERGLLDYVARLATPLTRAFSPELADFAGYLLARPRGGIATSMLINWANMMSTGRFADLNGDEFPLNKIAAPIHLVTGEHDWLTNVKHLSEIPEKHVHHLAGFGHVDFLRPDGQKFDALTHLLEEILNDARVSDTKTRNTREGFKEDL
jgi:pimeloyl-ACP methyl ester carboxylesterase